jgi:formamidopyrimidine-DNA glycosylase
MPELPEVETIRCGLSKTIVGKTISTFEVLVARSFVGFSPEVAQVLLESSVTGLRRYGKLLVIDLNSNNSLLVHLRMTGQLVYRTTDKNESASFGGGAPTASLVGELPDKSTRIIIEFTDGSHLYFNDQRKFGYMMLVPTNEVEQNDFVMRLGPEPLSDDFSLNKFQQTLPLKSSRSIKAVILDQNVIAGIGNIYADESLFIAGIEPERAVNSLTKAELKRLHAGIRECLQLSIDSGGSTARNYVDSLGLRGEYLDLHAKVYNRAGQLCSKCGGPIAKKKVAGRGTHYCPRCQK